MPEIRTAAVPVLVRFRYVKRVTGPEGEKFTVESEQFVQVVGQPGVRPPLGSSSSKLRALRVPKSQVHIRTWLGYKDRS